jgi:hypothetical protein
MDVIKVNITAYNREPMLVRLLDQLFVEADRARVKIVVDIFDDCTPGGYKGISSYDVNVVRLPNHVGKQGYYKLVSALFSRMRRSGYEHSLILPDDVELCVHFFGRMMSYWDQIANPRKATLNLLLDESREGKACWTGYHPRKRYGVLQTQWMDMCCYVHASVYEALSYRMLPIPAKRWRYSPTLSSGVGEQISRRLHRMNYAMFQVPETLCYHGDHDSVMNPEIRHAQPLLSKGKTAR